MFITASGEEEGRQAGKGREEKGFLGKETGVHTTKNTAWPEGTFALLEEANKFFCIVFKYVNKHVKPLNSDGVILGINLEKPGSNSPDSPSLSGPQQACP